MKFMHVKLMGSMLSQRPQPWAQMTEGDTEDESPDLEWAMLMQIVPFPRFFRFKISKTKLLALQALQCSKRLTNPMTLTEN